MFYYKKVVLTLIFHSIICSTALLAVNDTLENNTDGDLSVRVDYLSNATPCSFNVFTAKKNEKINISSRSNQCKVQSINVSSINGSLNGQTRYTTVDNASQKTSVFVTVHRSSINMLTIELTSQ